MAQLIVCNKSKVFAFASRNLFGCFSHFQSFSTNCGFEKSDIATDCSDDIHDQLVQMNKQLRKLQQRLQFYPNLMLTFSQPLNADKQLSTWSNTDERQISLVSKFEGTDTTRDELPQTWKTYESTDQSMSSEFTITSKPLSSTFEDAFETHRVENLPPIAAYVPSSVTSDFYRKPDEKDKIGSETFPTSTTALLDIPSSVILSLLNPTSDNSINKQNKDLDVCLTNVSKLPGTEGNVQGHIVTCSGNTPQKTGGSNESAPRDKLQLLHNHLVELFTQLFIAHHDYRIYTQDVVFENNWQPEKGPVITRGLFKYALQLTKFRTMHRMKYANIRTHMIRTDIDEVNSEIKLQFRISGLPQSQAFMFWKFLPWKYAKATDDQSEWAEGISTFKVNSDGFIVKHTLSRMVFDDEMAQNKKPSLVSRLLGALSPKPVPP